ncbi:DUF3298 and DUF4163 domain-containing protein [Abyssisolibacter fermentans]|uniref:DUF3298 and DUF4163 domain-containing protein n=1 Tax=Abyssisolibacter fermentans TaxID=1766203 RepID=UPI00082FA11F|nr:DUF3298 and DUF4163 domain-containing protein [Abyssisolibacter fermentans]
MDPKFDNAIKKYKSIKIPEELDDIVNSTIKRSNMENKKSKRLNNFKRVIAGTVVACSIFTVGLNTSEVFASKIANIPVLGNIAKVFTFVDYKINNEVVDADIKIPSIEGVNDKELEKRINDEIHAKMAELTKEAERNAEEDKKAFVETGGKEEDFSPFTIKSDYELKLANEKILSFIVYQSVSQAYSYENYYYYNINLETNKMITLDDMLGKDYKKIIDEDIVRQIEELKKNPDNSFFEANEGGFKGIKDDQRFYINEQGKVVIVFDKYEIAPGYMGRLEFAIK